MVRERASGSRPRGVQRENGEAGEGSRAAQPRPCICYEDAIDGKVWVHLTRDGRRSLCGMTAVAIGNTINPGYEMHPA